MGKEEINEKNAQDILDELEQEQKHDEEWVRWYNEQHYNNTHPTAKNKKKHTVGRLNRLEQTIRTKGEKK